MPEIEGLGDAATGAVLARAVEPRTGEADGHSNEANCLNCGCELVGAYCHCCGQRGHVHRTIAAWWHDFLHAVLHIDGKFWSTLGLLAWRPGDLTRRYAHGERAKFVSPLALFLFTVFLMFAFFSALGAGAFGSDPTGIDAGFAEEVRAAEERVAELGRERAASLEAGQSAAVARYDRAIVSASEDLETMRSIRAGGLTDASKVTVPESFPDWVRAAVVKAAANPSLMVYKLQANAYKFSWALIPISVPFVWLLFLHRRRYRRDFTGYDHLVFVTYSISFMSLVLIAMVLVDLTGTDNILPGLAVIVVPPLHIYKQLRGAYGLSRWSAAWRTLALLLFAGLALTLFLLLLLAIGVFG